MSDQKLKISEVLAWDLSALSLVVAKVRQASTTLDQEAVNADAKVQQSGDYFGDQAGQEARGASTKHKSDATTTADSYQAIASVIDDANHALAVKISTLRTVVREVEESKWDLAYKDTTGDVYSRKSNWATATSTSPYGAAAVALKAAAQMQLSGDLTQAFYDIKEIDKLAAQAVARCLETLTDSVKNAVIEIPADADLARILKDYQTDDSKSGTNLWPGNTLLNLLRLKYPDLEPIEMTSEEADALDELANPLNGGNPANALKFFNIKNEAEALGGGKDPNANKYTQMNEDSAADGQADALRHTYWNARMTQEFGEDWTKKYATAHEKSAGNPPAREAMDLFNNERGRTIAGQHPDASPDELKARIIESIDRGEMVVIAKPTVEGGVPQLAKSDIPVTDTAIIAGADIPMPTGKF
ncbi:DUF6973 domain-containing protein [Nocardia sp. NPDC059240]|uniref:DUF6973 domain-containing protein n=1 Tax=Nocardia sp. NPDC059240 TaxID=3346786 RepID=UPI0036C44F2E